MKADRFDMLALTAAVALAAAAALLGLGSGPEASAARPPAARTAAARPPEPAVYQELDRAEALLDSGQPDATIEALMPLSAANPSMSEPHALMGQAYARLLDYPAAMREFRIALVMDPEYVDKKSGKFIGKRIKAAVRDGMAEAKAGLAKDQQDKAARAALKDAYYIERMLAGGCE